MLVSQNVLFYLQSVICETFGIGRGGFGYVQLLHISYRYNKSLIISNSTYRGLISIA